LVLSDLDRSGERVSSGRTPVSDEPPDRDSVAWAACEVQAVQERLETLNRIFAAVPARLIVRKRAVWASVIALTIVMGLGASRIEIEMSMESFFLEDDPVKLLHDRFQATFGSDDGVYIVYEAKDGDVLSRASLEAVRSIQQILLVGDAQVTEGDAKQLDRIMDVTTLVNASYREVDGDLLLSRDFVETIPPAGERREALRRAALAHDDYPHFYISSDSKYGGIFIRTDLGLASEAINLDQALDPAGPDTVDTAVSTSEAVEMAEYAEFARALTRVIQRPGHSEALVFYPVGNPILMAFFHDVLIGELEGIFAGALFIMMLVLAFLFRSVSAVLWPISIVILTAAFTLGLLGWLGIQANEMISVLVILILVVGIADAVHIMSGYLHWRRSGRTHIEALEETYRKSGVACLLTSVTSALGMLSLWIVPLPPIRAFGFAAATGVLFAFGFTVMLLPVMLDLWPPVQKGVARLPVEGSHRLQRLLTGIEPIATRWARLVAVVFFAAGALGIYGATQVEVDTNVVEIIRPGLPIREAHELVDHVMGGTQGMEIYLDFGTSDALKDPNVLNAMDAMQHWLENEHPDFVVRTDSLVDVVKDTFRLINEGREEMYRVPQDPAMLAQTLLLFEMASPEDRELLAPDDYSEARVNIRLFNYGSSAYVVFFDDVQRQAKELFAPLSGDYPDLDVGITGNLPLLMRMSDYIGQAQIQSFGLVLIVVTLLLLVVFGSVRAGLVAMVPNVYPVLITFGVMGLWGMPLDADTLIIAPLIIGIAVDDTIHFITHYRSSMLETGDRRLAVASTIQEVGQAITFTSVILVLGFLVLLASTHQGMANFGVLIGVAMFSALLADLLLLPALLKLCRVDFQRG